MVRPDRCLGGRRKDVEDGWGRPFSSFRHESDKDFTKERSYPFRERREGERLAEGDGWRAENTLGKESCPQAGPGRRGDPEPVGEDAGVGQGSGAAGWHACSEGGAPLPAPSCCCQPRHTLGPLWVLASPGQTSEVM